MRCRAGVGICAAALPWARTAAMRDSDPVESQSARSGARLIVYLISAVGCGLAGAALNILHLPSAFG